MPATAKEAMNDGPPLSPKLREQIVSATHKMRPSAYTFEELAQNGRGVNRATQRASEFLCCLVARIRALCALLDGVNFTVLPCPSVIVPPHLPTL